MRSERQPYISRRSFSMVSFRKAISASASETIATAFAARASASVAFASAVNALASAAARAFLRVSMFGKKLSREKFLVFLSEAPPCLVVMEACGGAHYWGRQIIALGHTCKLIPPIYVKPFLKRQKNDSNDAAAIVEAAQRPTMRFVAVKSEEAQADAMLFRTRALLVRQRTQTINSLRGQLAKFGMIVLIGVEL